MYHSEILKILENNQKQGLQRGDYFQQGLKGRLKSRLIMSLSEETVCYGDTRDTCTEKGHGEIQWRWIFGSQRENSLKKPDLPAARSWLPGSKYERIHF